MVWEPAQVCTRLPMRRLVIEGVDDLATDSRELLDFLNSHEHVHEVQLLLL